MKRSCPLSASCLAAIAFLLASVAQASFAAAKVVAIADVGDESEKDLAVFESAVRDAGFELRKIKGHPEILAKPETYDGIDAIVLTGGWGEACPTIDGCRQLVRFAARGGGVFLGAFRGGGVRTFGHPAFPDIAETFSRANSPWMKGVGDSDVARAFGSGYVKFQECDHIYLKSGARGEVFAKAGDNPVGVMGKFGFGRVIVFGIYISMPETCAGAGRCREIFKAIAEYLAEGDDSAPQAERDRAADEAVAEFDRRMLVFEWTCDGRGGGRKAGIIPGLRDESVVAVEGRAMLLEFFARELKDRALSCECGVLAGKVREVSNAIRKLSDERCREVVSGCFGKSGNSVFTEDPKSAEEKVAAEFAALAAKSPNAEADALVEKARVALRAQRKAERAAEHAEDIKLLPSLVSSLVSSVEGTRLDAATELGRIGEATPEVVSALVAALDDCGDRVRVQAAISLGWMQAKDAVPALIAKARQNADFPLKRRAIQSLGQIGDDRAIPEVLAALDSDDRYSVENAILALGWLKANAAVPRLIEMATDESKPVYEKLGGRSSAVWNVPVANVRASAIVALGYIGDNSAVSALENVVRSNKPFREDANPLDSCIGTSLNHLAKESLSQIAEGGRAERGVRQPEALSSRAAFYATLRANNTLAGRINTVTKYIKALDGHETRFLPYLLDAGFTGIHAGWDMETCATFKGTVDLIREMDDYGLVGYWIAPERGFAAFGEVLKAPQERSFSLVGDCASYAGLWSEEGWPVRGYYSGINLAEDKDPGVCDMSPAARMARVSYFEGLGVKMDMQLRETQDWLHARRKGFSMTYSVSTACPVAPIGGFSAFGRIDSPGPESYESFGRMNSYLAERFRNGDTKAVMSEYYNWFTPSNEHVLRGCWANAVHSKCFYAFAVNQFSPFFGSYAPWTWDKGRWELYASVARRIHGNKELFAVSPSATEVAVLLSERSAASFRHTAVYRQATVPESMDQDALAVWTALAQSHIQSDVVILDGASEAKLAKYKVVFLGSAKTLSARDMDVLRKWVSAGGTLVCEGGVSLFDAKDLARRSDYAVSDILGVRYAGTDFVKSKEVFAQRTGDFRGEYVFPAEKNLDNFFRFAEYIYRDFKPSDCIAAANDGALGVVEYDAALGIDKVELAGAKEVQAFSDGSPALVVNEYGNGKVYFFAAHCPSYGHVTSRWEMSPSRYDFWPGVRETYEKIARDGLAHAGAVPAVDLLGASKEVELTVYSQKGGRRLVAHLLDYDVTNAEVSGASLRINGSRNIKTAYRPGVSGDRTELPLCGRTTALSPFKVYDMVVVEFE